MPHERETEAALDVARRAGELALDYFAGSTPEEEKPDLSPVTEADRACERLIARLLTERFPDDGILGEEGAAAPSRSGRRWIVDPIDGTRDFVRRTPFWAVLIALEERGRVVAGVIHLPALGETVHAAAGAGCYLNGSRVRASAIARLDKAVVMISGFRDLWQHADAAQVRAITESCWTVRAYSGCYDLTLLARGKADVWLSGSGNAWDHAPARIIALESGAEYFNFDGGTRIDAGNCIICAPGLEAEVRSILGVPAGREHR